MQRGDPLHPSKPLFIAGLVLIFDPLVPHRARVQFQEQTLSLGRDEEPDSAGGSSKGVAWRPSLFPYQVWCPAALLGGKALQTSSRLSAHVLRKSSNLCQSAPITSRPPTLQPPNPVCREQRQYLSPTESTQLQPGLSARLKAPSGQPMTRPCAHSTTLRVKSSLGGSRLLLHR
jgi:hypothetical protein